MRLCFACLALTLTACTADVAAGRGVALRDPLGLVDDVYGAGNALRIYVLPADSFSCATATGAVTPEPPDSPDRFADAIVDVSPSRAELSGYSVTIPPGDYVVLARGKGTDPVSGRMNVFIASGCATTGVGDGETVGVTVELQPIFGMGECGDGILSPDEQCETGAPACTDCRTVAEELNTTTALDQTSPRVAARAGQRVVVAWENEASSVYFRLFDPNGRPLTGMGPLSVDAEVLLPSTDNIGGVAVAPDGRIAIALVNFVGDANARVVFYSQSMMQLATPELRSDRAGVQNGTAIAYHSGGAALAVFQDARASTGLSARGFDAGSTTPSGDEAFEIGQTGGTTPAIAATSSGYVVVFAALGQVYYQRFGADGAPVDASPQPVAEGGGAKTAPSVAALADGTFCVAWAEANAPGDGMGSGVRARVFSEDGTPAGAAVLVNDVVASDQDQPAVAAAGTRFFVAFRSGGSVRARVLNASGDRARNREQPPTDRDFEVAAAGARPSVAAIGAGADQAWWVVYQAPGTAGLDVFGRRYPL